MRAMGSESGFVWRERLENVGVASGAVPMSVDHCTRLVGAPGAFVEETPVRVGTDVRGRYAQHTGGDGTFAACSRSPPISFNTCMSPHSVKI